MLSVRFYTSLTINSLSDNLLFAPPRGGLEGAFGDPSVRDHLGSLRCSEWGAAEFINAFLGHDVLLIYTRSWLVGWRCM